MSESTHLRDRAMDNARTVRIHMSRMGFKVLGDAHPIVPIFIGDERTALGMRDDLLTRGVIVGVMRYPEVPMGEARLRVQSSAAHSGKQINQALEIFADVGKKYGVCKFYHEI